MLKCSSRGSHLDGADLEFVMMWPEISSEITLLRQGLSGNKWFEKYSQEKIKLTLENKLFSRYLDS